MNGGGVRGLITLQQLEYLHKLLGDKFFTHFKYMAGTSTGALCVGLFAVGYTPKEVSAIYEEHLQKIFKKGFFRQLRGLSKYENKYIKDLAYRLIGDITLGELKQNILIPAINSDTDQTKIFKSFDEKDKHYKLVDVILASAAAPTYFPAYQIEGEWYKDGGLSFNNPSDILLAEARKDNEQNVNIISFTTGRSPKMTKRKEKKGNVLSVVEMIDEMLDQQDIKTHGSVSFEYKYGNVKGDYIRCESIIEKSSGKIDDVSSENITNMLFDGISSLKQNSSKIKNFLKK